MGAESVNESWFRNFWRTSRKSSVSEPEKSILGILAFEVSVMMSKIINLWHLIGDRSIERLREEITISLGIQKLVSEDDDYLMNLAMTEVISNVGCVAKSIARLGKRCTHPAYHDLENILDDPIMMDLKFSGWEYRVKKMERKVKKMERFIGATMQLTQELEVLAENEQTLRRMQAGRPNSNSGQVKLIEFQQKVIWQRLEVKNLQEMSPWVRSHDYIVRLLLRSIFTIISRIKYVFGIEHNTGVASTKTEERSHCEDLRTNSLTRSRSVSGSIYPSETNMSAFYSGPVVRSLERSLSSKGLSSVNKNKINNHKILLIRQSSVFCGKPSLVKARRLAPVASFGGCIKAAGNDSPVIESCMPINDHLLDCRHESKDRYALVRGVIRGTKVSFFNMKHKMLAVPPSTLGYAALALHYANIIIVIEKLAASPHLISPDARDDLYGMLPTSIRNSLRARLKIFTKTLASSVYNPSLAGGWATAVGKIIEWLSPLAHSTVRWHSERNFEKQPTISGSNVLLVQTLYFANQAKAEAAIVELLMGLNYLSRFGEEIYCSNKAMESSCSRDCDDYFLHQGISHCAINIGP
ncbi:unnamed protein product [Cuscuta epithymum]|uniref:DUF668 domain-containing protein n=2 Tax=Cuscuta epithymum TaxID=186058 RepID=A0AAV0E3S7_9ASTE|nr:unnamed protein product [Cuscuta epithymum]